VSPPLPPKDPEVDDEEKEAEPESEQYQPEPEQPPPPPPELVDVMARQTQLMQMMVEAMEYRGNGGSHNAPPGEDLMKKSRSFIRLKAPTISYSDQPLDADDWLRVIETKLDLTVCTGKECVAITAHQLDGSASLDGTYMPPAT
jgi:hypothetical protein